MHADTNLEGKTEVKGGEVRKGEAGGRAAKPRRIAVYVCLSVLHTYVHVHVAQSSLFARRGEEVAGRH